MSAPITGQVAVSGTAQSLAPAYPTAVAFTIKAPASNTHPVFIGPAGVTLTTGFQLDPGDTIDYERSDQSGQPSLQLDVGDFYVVGTAGDVVAWLASP